MWTRPGPVLWRGRCTPPPSFCPGKLDIPGLNDSKKLTEKKREALYDMITAQAAAWSVARVEAAEIDEDGHSQRPDAGHAAGAWTD